MIEANTAHRRSRSAATGCGRKDQWTMPASRHPREEESEETTAMPPAARYALMLGFAGSGAIPASAHMRNRPAAGLGLYQIAEAEGVEDFGAEDVNVFGGDVSGMDVLIGKVTV